MRLFVAIEVPEPWREAAREARRALDRDRALTGPPLRWVDPALMHLTLRFLGEVPDGAVPGLRRALDEHAPPVDLRLEIGAAGSFGAPARTSAVWLGVGGDGEALRALAQRLERAAQAAGLPGDEREFRGHLTLARVSRRAGGPQRRAVAEAVTRLPEPPRAEFRVRSVALIRSHLRPGAPPRYETLSRYGAGAGDAG